MVSSVNLENCIRGAADFIASNRSDDNLWRDFHTLAGVSSDWVSGFVAHALTHIDYPEESILGTLKTLLFRQRRNGGWSYNKVVPTDCDSTAWVLMSFSTATIWKPSSIIGAARYIKHHQSVVSGGFSTYSVVDNIGRFIGAEDMALTEGWRDVHPCVTAVALQSLLVHGEPIRSDSIRSAARYLLQEREPSGIWQSYWWKGYAYSTYHSMRALHMTRSLKIDDARKTTSFLLKQQKEDGGWNDSVGDQSEVFATAFNVLALLLIPDENAIEAANRGADWLLRKQNADGSWPTAPILRIPPPMEQNPERVELWRLNEDGTGVIIEDQAKIFTSAAALWSLGIFNSMIE